jgi:hypothetical protein
MILLRFFADIYRLYFWSMFAPRKLEELELSLRQPDEGERNFYERIFSKPRFAWAYLFWATLACVPITIGVIRGGEPLGWVLVAAFYLVFIWGMRYFAPVFGVNLMLLTGVVVWVQPQIIRDTFAALQIMPQARIYYAVHPIDLIKSWSAFNALINDQFGRLFVLPDPWYFCAVLAIGFLAIFAANRIFLAREKNVQGDATRLKLAAENAGILLSLAIFGLFLRSWLLPFSVFFFVLLIEGGAQKNNPDYNKNRLSKANVGVALWYGLITSFSTLLIFYTLSGQIYWLIVDLGPVIQAKIAIRVISFVLGSILSYQLLDYLAELPGSLILLLRFKLARPNLFLDVLRFGILFLVGLTVTTGVSIFTSSFLYTLTHLPFPLYVFLILLFCFSMGLKGGYRIIVPFFLMIALGVETYPWWASGLALLGLVAGVGIQFHQRIWKTLQFIWKAFVWAARLVKRFYHWLRGAFPRWIGFARGIPPGLKRFLARVGAQNGFRKILAENKNFAQLTDPIRILKRLPPYTSDQPFFQLPGHSALLCKAFETDEAGTLGVVEDMLKAGSKSLRATVANALPVVVTDQLAKVNTIEELARLATSKHPVLPVLLPSYYDFDDVAARGLETPAPRAGLQTNRDIAILLPLLQAILWDVRVGMDTGSVALKFRLFSDCLDNLNKLENQISLRGLNSTEATRWTPVMHKWEAILGMTIEALKAQSPVEIYNPYQYGAPVIRRPYLFKGRTKFADLLVQSLLDQNRNTIILHGPRRIGKSSFLNNLPRLLPGEILPVFYDLQRPGLTDSDQSFWLGIAMEIARILKGRQENFQQQVSPDDFMANPYAAIDDFLEQVTLHIRPRRLLLCLDEFEHLAEKVKAGKLSTLLLDEIRNIIQYKDYITFLLAGVQTLENLGTSWSNDFINSQPVEMLYLEREEARDLLVNPDPSFDLQYPKEVVDEILDLTGCHPYLVQLAGEAVFKEAYAQHTKSINWELFRRGVAGITSNKNQPYFNNILDEFTGASTEDRKAGRKLLFRIASGIRVEGYREEEERSLEQLTRLHVLRRAGNGYQFEIPLTKEWIKNKGGYSS